MRRLIILILLSVTCAFAAPVDDLILKKEKEIIAEMKKKKSSNQEIFDTYVGAGDEFTLSGEHKWAAYFYKAALKLDVKDHLPAYFRALGALLASHETVEAKKLFAFAEAEFKQLPRNEVDGARMALYKVLTSNNLHEEVLDAKELALLHRYPQVAGGLKRHDLKVNLQRGNFGAVTSFYAKATNIERVNIDEKILVDLAATLDKKSPKRPLLCRDQFERFPNSRETSYTMAICQMLITAREKKKATKDEFQKASALIEANYPQNKYLLPVLKKLL